MTGYTISQVEQVIYLQFLSADEHKCDDVRGEAFFRGALLETPVRPVGNASQRGQQAVSFCQFLRSREARKGLS